jgi:hypothetical protein
VVGTALRRDETTFIIQRLDRPVHLLFLLFRFAYVYTMSQPGESIRVERSWRTRLNSRILLWFGHVFEF